MTLYWVLVNKLIAPFATADPVFVGNIFIHIFFCKSDRALDEVSVFFEVSGKQNTACQLLYALLAPCITPLSIQLFFHEEF